MKKRDKLDCQEIKELILKNNLSLSALSESSLRNLIEYEAECLMGCETEYDTTFMDLCTNALIKIQNTTSVPSDEKIKEIGDRAYREYLDVDLNQNDFSMPTTILPPRKLARILIAAAIITALLTVSAIACWNPFISWLNERRITDIKQGEILQNESGDLTVDNQIQIFDTIKEMENALGIEFDTLDSITVSPQIIQLTQHQFGKEIKLSYTINQEPVVFRIFIENAPYYKEPLEKAGLDKQTVFNLEWYVIEDDCVTLVAFDNDYVYAISIDSLDTLAILTEGK